MDNLRLAGLLCVVAMMAAGQILFKLAASRFSGQLTAQAIPQLLLDPFLIVGVALYGLTTVLWVLLLVDGELSKSYPFTALALVLVSSAGIVFFNEAVTPSLIVGGAMIIGGLTVIAYF